jgi:hypothetical protein
MLSFLRYLNSCKNGTRLFKTISAENREKRQISTPSRIGTPSNFELNFHI